jgi:BrnA antitoxin of type II toxin-antitoxin system
VNVVEWFRSQGRGYQARMDAVLRRYMEVHRKLGETVSCRQIPPILVFDQFGSPTMTTSHLDAVTLLHFEVITE